MTPTLEAMLEKDWDAQLFNSEKGVATQLGWRLVYHTLRSKGSRSGFPDRVLVRDRVIFAELKREKTAPTEEQIRWLDGLARAGSEVYLWRPSDLEEIGRILGKRWTLTTQMFSSSQPILVPTSSPSLCVSLGTEWRPRSLWIAGQGRVDAVAI